MEEKEPEHKTIEERNTRIVASYLVNKQIRNLDIDLYIYIEEFLKLIAHNLALKGFSDDLKHFMKVFLHEFNKSKKR